MSENYQLSLPLVDAHKTDDPIAQDLKQQEALLGFIPNMYAAMATVPMVLKSYLYSYNLFREETQFSSIEQEVIFLTISRTNHCHYCMAAHSFVADKMSGVPMQVTEQLREGNMLEDTKLQALVAFTFHMIRSQGRPSREAVAAFLSQGYNEKHILEIIVALSSKILSNYTNHLFDTELDDVFKPRQWHG